VAGSKELDERRSVDKPRDAGSTKKVDPPPKKQGGAKLNPKRVRLGAAALLVVAAVVVGIVALAGGSDGKGSSGGGEGEAVSLSAAELIARTSGLGGPAYWIGPRAGTSGYELTDTSDGRIYIRYLTGSAEAGDPRPAFLTVGTYPVEGAKRAIESAAKNGEGGTLSRHDGYEVLDTGNGSDAYVVFDSEPDVQVEVFSPQRGEATQLATSGALKPVR
jgi:hypothetical protein